ncbi:helix-turn-helix domain-containing protein [Natrinema sp. 1APR25-10V2]|uniref:ArsR/SmtB family transcription factor n=1 Tax=Natrinema sp. 1APR25-10V2 TaxID=2951081 RepID=UPI002875B6C0|nr:helix-turn-helix domain-containing protein [Natrinema sp. 1APR25-10V2]MDS0476429.1 helix-turn-helix domain-containing protein [Natrinema sp. 1APR25-10V2]
MARLFPFRSETAAEEGQPRVVDLEGEDADAVFAALSSTTARRIYAHLDDEPATPSDIADAIDSSIQNVRYHLEKLEDAGLVEVVDTWYSSRGNEMSVYATTDGPLIVTSDESRATQLKEALSRFIGGVGALAGGSLLVQYGLTRWLGPAPTGTADGGSQPEPDGTGGGNAGGDSSDGGGFGIESVNGSNETSSGSGGAEQTDSALDAGNETAQNATDGGVEAAEAVFETVPPGLLFFLGGLVVLLAVTIYWYWYRPAY